MNVWARNRKRLILAIVMAAILLVVGVPAFFLFRSTPTCSDGVMNGDEQGVDCGGSCQRLCSLQSLPLVLKGDPRILLVSTSTYEVVAVVENPNQAGRVAHATYTLTLYGSDALSPVKSIQGETYVPQGATFAIFEGPFAADATSLPTHATLTWDERSLTWEKVSSAAPALQVEQAPFERLASSPRLPVTVTNPSLTAYATIELTALVYDGSGTIFAASKTLVDRLPAGGSTQAIFTWPRPFASTPVQVDVITRVLPDQSYIR